MKNLILIFFVMVCVFLMPYNAYSLADDDSSTVSAITVYGGVIFYGTISFSTDDSTNNIYTQAMDISYLKPISMHVYTNAATGIDINLFIAGANHLDLTYFADGYTDPNLDDLNSATAKIVALDQYYAFIPGQPADLPNTSRAALGAADTVGNNFAVPVEDPVFKCRYIALKADGQSGNPATATLTFYIYCEYTEAYYREYERTRSVPDYLIEDTT